MTIRSVAVLGAGTMGAQIAAHVANAGVPVLLLDLTADVAREGLERARTMKPDPFFTTDTASLITVGGFDEDFRKLSSVDWIMEAVVEQIEIKAPLLKRVDGVRRPGTIVSSNTSGIPIASLAEGRSDDFRRHWLGTHFFNPPRYLHLLEVIPTADTDRAVVDEVTQFADLRLGKGVVVAKDTPNFIANHLGVYGVVQVLRALESGKYTIEEIDAITGPALGRPRSATFRTMDIAGIDVLAHVAKNVGMELPPIVARLVERGWIGEKAGQGFYKRQKTATGTEILTLDPETMTYRPRQSARLASLDAARSIEDTRERIRTLFAGNDKVGEFLHETLEPTLCYAAKVAPDIAYANEDVDRAMRWGFGWELGPFELMQTLGMQGAPRIAPDLTLLKSAKDRQRVVKKNAGASLVDIGDGVLALEFHSKMNAIGGDTVQMMHAGVKEAAANFAALVVGSDAPNFSVGANLMLLLLEAQEGNWDEIDLMVRAFQDANLALRYAEVPVVVATAGMTFGGGCEIALHADRVQAAAESYIGLVEVGVGLIPGGGGTKEMLARAVDGLPASHPDLLPFVQRVFETIGFGKVSTSAADARRLGFLARGGRHHDEPRSAGRGREGDCAGARARGLPPPRGRAPAIPVGGEGVLAALKLGVHLAWRAGRISDHDAVVGRALAYVLAGGALPHQTDRERAVSARPRARGIPEAVRRAEDARADSAHAEDRQAVEELTADPERCRIRGANDHRRPRNWTAARAVPGLQGRWEYMRADGRRARGVVPGDHVLAATGPTFDELSRDQVGRALDAGRQSDRGRRLRRLVRRADRAPVRRGAAGALPCARARVDAAPGADAAAAPRDLPENARGFSGRLFLAETPFRVRRELRAAMRDPRARRRFSVEALRTFVARPGECRQDGGARAADHRRRVDRRLRADCGADAHRHRRSAPRSRRPGRGVRGIRAADSARATRRAADRPAISAR